MSESIYFPLAYGDKLTHEGRSDWCGLATVLTLDETAKLEQHGEEHRFVFQTDAEGLAAAIRLGEHTAEALGSAVAVIGKLLVHVDHRELDPGDMGALGWLLCGLGDLSQQVNGAMGSFSRALAEGAYLKTRISLDGYQAADEGNGHD